MYLVCVRLSVRAEKPGSVMLSRDLFRPGPAEARSDQTETVGLQREGTEGPRQSDDDDEASRAQDIDWNGTKH